MKPTTHFHTCHSCGCHWQHSEHRPEGRCSLLKVALCDRCFLGVERLPRAERNARVHPGYLEHPNPEGDR